MNNEDVLIHADEQGSWGWAGFRLVSVLGPETANHFADFDRSRREERTADAETAWLAAQWGVHWSPQWGPGGAGRFELRYRNDPAMGDGLVRCACLCRVRAASPREAVDQARAYRGSLASGLPGHVRAEPLTQAADVHGWLVPFERPGPGDSQIELVKKLNWQRAVRQDLGRGLTVQVARLAARRVSWEPLLRRLGGLPFPAVLSIGFEPFPRLPAFRAGLEQLAAEYALLARPAAGSPVYSATTLADPFTAKASQRYAQYAHQYDAPAFRVRISLVGEQDLPGQLGTWLAAALGDIGPDGASASAVLPVEHERDMAWTNLATLGAGWLNETYRGSLPDSALGSLERELMTLVDLAEARSLIQLPISWPGHPELFAGLVDEWVPLEEVGPEQELDLWQAAPESTDEEQDSEELEDSEEFEELASEEWEYEDQEYVEPASEDVPVEEPLYDELLVQEPPTEVAPSEEPWAMIGDPALRQKISAVRSFQVTATITTEYVFAPAEAGLPAQDDLRSLDRWLNDRAELDADVELRTRPPGPGELGGQPESVAAWCSGPPLARAYFSWLRERVRRQPVSMTVFDQYRDRILAVKVANIAEADRLRPEISDFFRDDEDG